MGTAIDTSIPMIETTMRISISVKPRRLLPLRVRGSIASLIHAVSIDVEHVLPAPGVGFGIVLHDAFSPLPCAGHRIERNPAQEFDFLIHLVGELDTLHQAFQRLGVAFRSYFQGAEITLVR